MTPSSGWANRATSRSCWRKNQPAPTADLQPGRQFGAFLDGALGVQLRGQRGAADLVEARAAAGLGLFLGRHQLGQAVLAGADDDVVDRQQALLAADRDVQAIVVDLVVLDAAYHHHAVARQRGAVHPAGRLAQTRAQLGGLALQQVQLAHRLLHHRRHQAAAAARLQIDAPLLGPGLQRQRQSVARIVQQEFADVEDGDALADRRLVLQHVDIRQHFRMSYAGDSRKAHLDAGGDDHVVVAAGQQLLARDAHAQLQLHADRLDLAAEVAYRLRELLLAGNLHGDLELAADAVAGIEQGDVMAAFGGDGGGRQPGRPGADHRHAARPGADGVDQFRLVAGARIDQATGALVGERVVQAGLVAADAGVDFVGAAFGGLDDKVRVGQEGPCHRHHVGIAALQNLLGLVRHIDAVRRDDGYRHLAPQPAGHAGEGAARHRRDDGRHARLVPAVAGVDDGDAGLLQRLGDRDHVVPGVAAINQVEQRVAVHDDEVGTDGGADAFDDFDRQAHAVLDAAAPAVLAQVGARAQELVEQIAFAAHHFDAVVAGVARQPGAACVVGDGPLDAGLAQRARLERRDRRFFFRRRNDEGLIAVAARVQDLHQDLASLLVHGAGDAPVVEYVALEIERPAERQQPPGAVGRNAAGDDQTHAAARALAIERGQLAVVVEAVFEAGVHGAHDDAVTQRREAEVEGRQQMRIGLSAHYDYFGGRDNVPHYNLNL